MSELERDLVELGRELAVPAAPDLVPAVRERLEPRAGDRRERRRWALAVAVAVLALVGATLAIPEARSAFFRILDVGGERIQLVDELPEIEVAEDLESTLGERVTLEDARERAGFELRELDDADPDRVYLGERGTVWLLYGSPVNPRLLVAQTPLLAVDEPTLFKKVASEADVELVAVDGARGLFVGGAHYLFLVDESGVPIEASARLAEDVLLWDQGGVAYRLEGDFDRERALELARTLR
jgi:hypothetical protein